MSAVKRVFPLNFVLRHYSLRNPEQARRKVLQERIPRFTEERRERGWHVHYDALVTDHPFIWPPDELNTWEWDSPREWCPEITTRAGLPMAT